MFRKIVFALFLIAALVATSASAPVVAKNNLPAWEKVFTPPYPEGQYVNLWSTPVQFKGALYLSASVSPADPTVSQVGGQIWRSFDGKSWNPVTGPGFGIDPDHQVSWDTTVFKGKIYVPINCLGALHNCPGVLLRSANGTDWESVTLVTGPYYLDKLGEFKGMLYATSNAVIDLTKGGEIYRSLTGDPGTWTVVKELDIGTSSTSSPTEYQGRVYVTGYAGDSNNIIIWSSADGLNWDTQYVRITDSQSDWLRDGMLTVYQGNLYLCTTNWNDGGQIFRTEDGKHWQQVFQITPSGGFSVFAVEDMMEYKGDLYAATVFANSDWTDWGAQIWRSHSGKPGTWEKITDDADWLTVYPERGTFGAFNGQLYFLNSYGLYPALYRMDSK